MKQTLEQAAGDYIVQLNGEDLEGGFNAAFNAFKAGAEWQKEQPITFNCIGKQVTMTIQQLIDYYIDRECADVANECGF